MLSKLIVHAPDRRMAIARMQRAINEYFVGGIKTNLGLFRRILADPDFQAARIDTGFLDRLLSAETPSPAASDGKLEDTAAIAAAVFTATGKPVANACGTAANGNGAQNGASAWKKAARTEGVRER
jgi:acetyl-CoA carboxylase biotin carboxylase subunit